MWRFALAVAVLVSLLVAVPADAVCPFDPTDCYPRYNTTLVREPDWCLYETGDVVWDRTYVVNGYMHTDRWYVYHGDDPDAFDEPPVTWGSTPPYWIGPYYVINNNPNCGYITLP